MPSFPDSAVIILLALLLFGPKKLPVLARQFGKLMADFRRASNEFRTQMEDELRISEQAERQKQIAASHRWNSTHRPLLRLSRRRPPRPMRTCRRTIRPSNPRPIILSIRAIPRTKRPTVPCPNRPPSGHMIPTSKATPGPTPHCDLRRPEHPASRHRPAHRPTPSRRRLPEDLVPAHQATTETEALHA